MASTYLEEEAYVDVYLADHMPRNLYPYRLQQIKFASPTTAARSTKHILDSSINRDTDNADIYEKAKYLDVDVVVPTDEIHDPDTTEQRVLSMMEMIDGDGIRSIVPIQSTDTQTHVESTARMSDVIEDAGFSHLIDRYAIGGVKDRPVKEQLDIVTDTTTAHRDLDWHIFGAGMSKEWVIYIRQHPDRLTSIDMATPIYVSTNNRTMDYQFTQTDMPKPGGTNVSTVNARLIEHLTTNFNYMISDGPNENEIDAMLGL